MLVRSTDVGVMWTPPKFESVTSVFAAAEFIVTGVRFVPVRSAPVSPPG